MLKVDSMIQTLHPALIAAHSQMQQLQQQRLALKRAMWLRPPQPQQDELHAQLQQLTDQHLQLWMQLTYQQHLHPPVQGYLMYSELLGRPEVSLSAFTDGWLLGVVTDRLDLLSPHGQRGALIDIAIE